MAGKSRQSSSRARSSSSRQRTTSTRSGSDTGRRRITMPQSNPRRNNAANRGYGQVSTVRVGDVRSRTRQGPQRIFDIIGPWLFRIGLVVVLALLVVLAGMALSRTSLFGINEVEVTGVSHLTAAEVTELASVPSNSTLLRLDTAQVQQRLEANPWIESAQVNRKFPSTVELAITERTIAAVVEVPVTSEESIEEWAISSDGIWLMSIPKQGTEEAASVSAHVYEDAEHALRIVDVPYGTNPAVGADCDAEGVKNALEIVDALSLDLADLIETISASDVANTTLNLSSGMQIAFGSAEGARDKERVCLQLMSEYPSQIAYINVRVVEHPTWRAISQ